MTAQPSTDLAAEFRQQLLLAIVQRNIVCPVSREILDVRDCVVFVDRDGDPAAAVSQAGYQTLRDEHPDRLTSLAETGLVVDEATIGRAR